MKRRGASRSASLLVAATAVSCVTIPDIETRVIETPGAAGGLGGGGAFAGGAGGTVGFGGFGGSATMPFGGMPLPFGGTQSAGMPGTGGIATAGTGGSPLAYCDVMTREPLPMVVTNRFIASGYYDTSWQELMQIQEPCADRPNGAAGQCLGFTWSPLMRTWVGLLLQYPADNWTGPGLCIAEGANLVSFAARGAVGGERVDFSVLGAVTSTKLEPTWTRYDIDLRGVDYNDYNPQPGVRGAFSIVLIRDENDLGSKTIYVDDMQWLHVDAPIGGAGGADGAGGAGGDSAGMGGASGDNAGMGGAL